MADQDQQPKQIENPLLRLLQKGGGKVDGTAFDPKDMQKQLEETRIRIEKIVEDVGRAAGQPQAPKEKPKAARDDGDTTPDEKAILAAHAKLTPARQHENETAAISMQAMKMANGIVKMPGTVATLLANQQARSDPKVLNKMLLAYYEKYPGNLQNTGVANAPPPARPAAPARPGAPPAGGIEDASSGDDLANNAANWYVYKKYSSGMSALSGKTDKALIAQVTGRTVDQINDIMSSAVLRYRDQHPDEYGNPGYALGQSRAVQSALGELTIDMDAYRAWRDKEVASVKSNPKFLAAITIEFQTEQRREATARAKEEAAIASGRPTQRPAALDPNYSAVNLTSADQLLVGEYLLSHREGCGWKNGVYYDTNEPYPTTLDSCRPTGKATKVVRQ